MVEPAAPALLPSRGTVRPGKLRVGFVSSDFRRHAVARNVLPVLQMMDRDQFEIHCFSDLVEPDSVTDEFRAISTSFVSIRDLDDAMAASLIRDAGIDILVILAGRFDRNRPFIAAYRAAPIQISWHDVATSGLSTMDYLIADPILVPKVTAEKFTERVLYLPSFVIHAPISNAPRIGGDERNGKRGLVFGSFNNPGKLNKRVLGLWGKVLKACPGSRLKLKYLDYYADPFLCQRCLAALEVEPDRVEFIGAPDPSIGDHLAHYQDIDLALDSFPFSGSTTSFEALWMGVPVLTLAGERMVSRWTASMLHAVGLGSFIVQTEEGFIARAVAISGDHALLGQIRSTLRDRVAASALCDTRSHARAFERILHDIRAG